MPRARNFLLLSLIIIVFVYMVMCVWNWKNTEESEHLTEPRKHIPGLRSELAHVVQDRTLGSLVTHVLHPQRREHVRVPDIDPRILVSVKTTTVYHKQKLSLLLFTWLESISPRQVLIWRDENQSGLTYKPPIPVPLVFQICLLFLAMVYKIPVHFCPISWILVVLCSKLFATQVSSLWFAGR